MFNLDEIEKEWQENSYCLSEEEIIEIYRSEGVTQRAYDKELSDYYGNHVNSSVEERLLKAVYGDDYIVKKEEKQIPERKRISLESQKRVVEGCLDTVFDNTKYWYDYFEGQISQERLYYVCLDTLIKSAKYILHSEKPFFRSYVSTSITKNIIRNVAMWEKLTYREVYRIINNEREYDYKLGEFLPYPELHFKYDDKEEAEKPSKIYYRLRKERYDDDYTRNFSSDEFYTVYKEVLGELDETAKEVMQLVFDSNGNRILTFHEIAECLGIKENMVVNAKRRAIRKLKKDRRINRFKD